ncbi:MAG TPA: DedA family protein [Gemmatimonadaceae bacterium]|nr:DedA family protein [Gemmatimonadaceae bacterium]
MTDFLAAISRWLDSLPLGALYALLGITAFIEGIFPPVPADIVVALGSFLAARRGANLAITATCIVVGSVAGAMVVYGVARKFGAAWLHMRLKKAGIDNLEKRLEVMYSKYGMTALFVSRFLPGLRAVCPPMAGVTRVPPIRTTIVFLLASGIWYGAIAAIAFRVGDDWDAMQKNVKHFAGQVGVVACLAAALFAVAVFIVVRRRARDRLATTLAVKAAERVSDKEPRARSG